MLTPHQRRDLLRIEQSRDAAAITPAINQVLVDNPDTDLLEIEMTFRAAAGTAFLVATAEGFEVVIGMKNWVAALDALAERRNRTGRNSQTERSVTASERRLPHRLARPSISPRAIGIRYRAACIPR